MCLLGRGDRHWTSRLENKRTKQADGRVPGVEVGRMLTERAILPRLRGNRGPGRGDR